MKKLICAVAVLAVSTAQAGVVILVDAANCPGPGNGSEADPYCSIQTAIDNAVDTDEIVVAPGTYFETIDFLGKAVTLRSAGGSDVTTIDAGGLGFVTAVTCESGEGPDTVLEGFTLTGGTGTLIEIFLGVFRVVGGGMLNIASSPTVINCTFGGNAAIDQGGGMYNGSSSPTITGCTFIGNSAGDTAGGMRNYQSNPTMTNCTFSGNSAIAGGGMYNYQSSPTITNCSFSGNAAHTFAGGGMFSTLGSSPRLTNCTFSGNTAKTLGGGMNNGPGSPMVIGCTFDGNTAGQDGGGIFNIGSSPTVTDCTFSGNSATNGNALACDIVASELAMTNCILSDGGNEIWINDGSIVTVTYSDVQGGFTGTGNIDADPLFVDPNNGDYRLSPGSPCIDAGNNWGVPQDTADLDGDGDTRELMPWDLDSNPRFNADPADFDPGCGVPVVVDMGAYEFQFDPVDEVFLGDLDGNGIVGIVDFLGLLAAWGPCPMDCCLADLDIDGDVGITDFLLLLANWTA